LNHLFPLVLAVALALGPSASTELLACDLPADPYVVVKVSKDGKKIAQITNPATDFYEEEELPGANDPLTGKPYKRIQLPEDTALNFICLWDLSQGGTDPNPLGKIPPSLLPIAQLEMAKFSMPGEYLIPVAYYFQTLAGGKLVFKLAEMLARSGRGFTDPLAVVDFGGFVKDGDYMLTGGADPYLWTDTQLVRDNAPFNNTFASPRFPVVGARCPGPTADDEWRVSSAEYAPAGYWILESYSTEYHMDYENIGANIGSQENPPANDPGIQGGEYTFTYCVPSDPLAYHIVVGSALLFRLDGITWNYEEQLFHHTVVRDSAGNVTSDTWDPVAGQTRSGSIVVKGRLARSTQGLSAASRIASLLAAVLDRTAPCHVHLAPSVLKGTTGETLAAAATALGEPDRIQVRVIDNNPFAVRAFGTGAVTQGAEFNVANLGLDLYYSLQVYDYQPRAADAFPVDVPLTPKFVWAKADTSTGVTITDAKAYKQDGTEVALGADGKDADAVYSQLTYSVPLTAFKEPMGWHFGTTSDNWAGGHRLKFFAAARDGTVANLMPPEAKLPEVAAATASGSAPEHAVAAADVPATQFLLDKDNQEVATNMGLPVFTYPADHPAATCPVDKVGTYGFIDVYDNDWPVLFLRVTDTKYDKRVWFGNTHAGDLRREKARNGEPTNSNLDTLDPNHKPFSDAEHVLDFSEVYGSGANDQDRYASQIQDLLANPLLFKPAEYAATLPGGPKFGYWVDEDIPLVFEVFARDNINFASPSAATGGWGLTNDRLQPVACRDHDSAKPELDPPDTFLLYDSPTSGAGAVDPGPWPQHIFRNPNKPDPHTGDCHIEVEVADNGQPLGGGIHRTKLIVRFHVMDNKLAIQSLEENRVRSTSGTE
jgi:hypothetical protein